VGHAAMWLPTESIIIGSLPEYFMIDLKIMGKKTTYGRFSCF